MNSLEAAIRNALEKLGPGADAAQRAHIYQSARNALENGLRKQGIDNPAVISAQRRQLESAIHLIEEEVRVRSQLEAQQEPIFEIDPHDTEEQHAPRVELQREPAFAAARGKDREPAFEIGGAGERLGKAVEPNPRAESAAASIDEPPARAAKPRRVRRWKAKAFALVTVLAFAAVAWWWVQSSGLLLSADERDKSVPNPPPSIEDEDYEGATQLKSLSREGGFGDDWKVLFDANSAQKDFGQGPSAQAKLKNGGSGPYLEMISNATGPAGAISIVIPQDVLKSLQGKYSGVALTLQGGEKPVQVAVECDFAGLGNCGRHRFVLSPNKADLLFQIRVTADGSPTGPGKLVINPDAGGQATAARLYTVHVRPGG